MPPPTGSPSITSKPTPAATAAPPNPILPLSTRSQSTCAPPRLLLGGPAKKHPEACTSGLTAVRAAVVGEAAAAEGRAIALRRLDVILFRCPSVAHGTRRRRRTAAVALPLPLRPRATTDRVTATGPSRAPGTGRASPPDKVRTETTEGDAR